MNRRQWFRNSFIGATALTQARAGEQSASDHKDPQNAGQAPVGPELAPAEIYKLLGFATMSGEDPLKLWNRLRNTSEWLVGPLSPDAWSGQVFIADHADIFAFRMLPLPAFWTTEYQSGNLADFCASRFPKWFENWPAWWRTVGPKAPDNSYARLVWQMPDGGPQVTYEWAQTDRQEVVARITQSSPADILLQGYVPWDHNPPRYAVLYSESSDRRFLRGRSWIPGTRDGMRWVVALSEPVDVSTGVGTGAWSGVLRHVSRLHLCGRQGQSYSSLEASTTEWLQAGRIDDLLDKNRDAYLARRPEGEGWLADVPAAINDQLQWSEVYTPERKHAYITVSRAWARENNNSAPDFLWDSFFSALLVCQEDEKKAFALVRDITAWQNDQGMFAQYGQWQSHPDRWIFPVAWGHTQYPIGSLALSKIYLRHPDKAFLAEIYPKLLKAHKWWFSDRGDGQPWRDGNRNGLLELGSNYPEEIPYEDRQQTAYFESHDDSPQWWHVTPYNEKTNTCELETVERNCLYTMDAWVLAWMARELGLTSDALALEREHAEMAKRINELLWDEHKQCYFNRRWAPQNGTFFNPHMAPDIFMSLLGKVAPEDRTAALKKVFHDPEKFAGEWILPTISRDDPLYPKQHYWRGKVWAPINWLIYQGFRIYGWDDEARLLAEASAKMFLRPWRARGECYENFLATTGEGSSDPHYTWGALMVLIAIEELIDINPWHGLRFGNVAPIEEAAIRKYYVAGSLYDVSLSAKHIEVQRDKRLLFSCDAPVEIRHVKFDRGSVTCEVRSRSSATLQIGAETRRAVSPGVTQISADYV
jgi:Trehalase